MKKVLHINPLPPQIKNSFLFALFPILLLSFSCSSPCGNSKEAFLGKLDRLIEEAKQLSYPPDDERWEKYDKKMEVLFNNCYEKWKAELNVKEKAHVISQMLSYAYQRAKNHKIKEQLKDVLREGKEEFKALKEELRPLMDDLKSEVDEILKELE